ncbi:hypothetical protein TNCV_3279101 [Trichonephila clavipes]|nr:hypothetical protein TNCV_3279101 [Trichonephila clavipes]
MSHEASSSCAIHTFVDGSKEACAALTFLRLEKNNQIKIFLLAAKSRVSPFRTEGTQNESSFVGDPGRAKDRTLHAPLSWCHLSTATVTKPSNIDAE